MLAIPSTHDLLALAKPITAGRKQLSSRFRWLADRVAHSACPSSCPLVVVRTVGQVFDIVLLKCSGAKGTRTPGLLHAMPDESVWHGPGWSGRRRPGPVRRLERTGVVRPRLCW